MTRAKILLALVILLLPVELASSESDQQKNIQQLVSAKTIRIKLNEGFATEWKNNRFDSKKDKWDTEILIDSIDIKNNTARMVGNQGAGNCTVIVTPEAFNILDQSPSGNLFLLTIFPTLNSDGKYCVVYSRHMNLMGPLPSQYYGFAEILPQTE